MHKCSFCEEPYLGHYFVAPNDAVICSACIDKLHALIHRDDAKPAILVGAPAGPGGTTDAPAR
jgi:hypothetical protein